MKSFTSQPAMNPSTIIDRARRAARPIGAMLLGALSLLGSGCFSDTVEPTCGQAPPLPIHGFVVTTVTGENATDMDIEFCVLRKSAADYECAELDTAADNFEEWQTDTFQLSFEPIAAGDLEAFKVRNVGGGWFESSWDMHSITVQAVLAEGEPVLLYQAENVDVNIEEGEAYHMDDCTF